MVDLVCESLGRDPCIEERGVWAGVEAADEVWFLEDLKKDMVVVVIVDIVDCLCCLLSEEQKEGEVAFLLYFLHRLILAWSQGPVSGCQSPSIAVNCRSANEALSTPPRRFKLNVYGQRDIAQQNPFWLQQSRICSNYGLLSKGE